MAIDLSTYNFPFTVEELPDRDRAVLSVVVNGNDAQRAAIAGPRFAEFAAQAKAVEDFILTLNITEPDKAFATNVERAKYLAEAARVAVDHAFPGLHPEVARRAGNRYAFLNR